MIKIIEYRHLRGSDQYRIGTDSSVWSHKSGKWTRMTQRDSGHGYVYVKLSIGGKKYIKYVHRLMLETFVGPCPEGMECCHENRIRNDNTLTNLRWDTPKNNHVDRENHSMTAKGVVNGNSKLTDDKVKLIVKRRREGGLLREISKEFNIGKSTISYIMRGQRWKHVTNL